MSFGAVPTWYFTCCNASWSLTLVHVILVSPVSQAPSLKLFTICTCLCCIMFPVACAEFEQAACSMVSVDRRKSHTRPRQAHFGDFCTRILVFAPGGKASWTYLVTQQKTALAGCRLATCKVDLVECMFILPGHCSALYTSLLLQWIWMCHIVQFIRQALVLFYCVICICPYWVPRQ